MPPLHSQALSYPPHPSASWNHAQAAPRAAVTSPAMRPGPRAPAYAVKNIRLPRPHPRIITPRLKKSDVPMLGQLARLPAWAPPPRLGRASPSSPQTTSSPGSPAPTSASVVPHLLKGPRDAPRAAAILTPLCVNQQDCQHSHCPLSLQGPAKQPSRQGGAGAGLCPWWPVEELALGRCKQHLRHAPGGNMAGNQGVGTGAGSRSRGEQDKLGDGL